MEFFATTESLDPEALDSVNFNAPQNFSPEFAPPDPQVLKNLISKYINNQD